MKLLKDIAGGLLHLLYPSLCQGCRKQLIAGEEVLCMGCASKLPATNYHTIPDNETTLRFAGRLPFKFATSLAWFTEDGLLQHLLHGLKYQKKQEIGTYLGAQLGAAILQIPDASSLTHIVPVPLHRKKEEERGYNQSMLIAEGISAATGIPINNNLIVRARYTASQTSKTRAERLDNMKDAFVLTGVPAGKGAHLLLVDDVLTTGATIESCAHTLLQLPGVVVSIATVGIAQ